MTTACWLFTAGSKEQAGMSWWLSTLPTAPGMTTRSAFQRPVAGSRSSSDVYDNWINPITAGNGGGVEAVGPPRHGVSNSAAVTIPANGFIVFARDWGN